MATWPWKGRIPSQTWSVARSRTPKTLLPEDEDGGPATARQPAPGGAQGAGTLRTPASRRDQAVPARSRIRRDRFCPSPARDRGAGLSQFVKEEFEAFLECGMLAHGFLRWRCGECAQDTLVAFSCIRQGVLPGLWRPTHGGDGRPPRGSCIPRVPVRQWVMSFPIPLRHLFATHPPLLSPVLQVIRRTLSPL